VPETCQTNALRTEASSAHGREKLPSQAERDLLRKAFRKHLYDRLTHERLPLFNILTGGWLMQPIRITDPAWYTTFPHLVAPRENEWITGLLLRCDEVNHWDSGATLTYLLEPTNKRHLKGGVGLLKEEHLEKLADALAVPVSAILATTYQAELAYLYGGVSQNPGISTTPVPFHICPMCLGEDRMLRRLSTLPDITHCPLHGLSLVERCQRGTHCLSPATAAPWIGPTSPAPLRIQNAFQGNMHSCRATNFSWPRLHLISWQIRSD
jgi:hypothetical protein